MIVVTGGAGFIGSNVVAALKASREWKDQDIVVCDSFGKDDKWRNLAKHEIADVVAPEAYFQTMTPLAPSVSAVIHMGAISSTTERDVDLILNSNFRFSLDLWTWCARHGVRLIYASSAATYGDGAQGFKADLDPAALARLNPLNAYGWSKHLFDRRVARLSRGGRKPLQWAGLKFFNVFGPNEYHKGEMRSLIAKSYPRAKAGEAVRLFKSHDPRYADGGQLRDFVYVKDAVDVILWLLDNSDVNGLFNVGTGKARSFADLIGAMYRAMNLAPKIDYVDMPMEIRNQYQYFTEADMSGLRQAGYRKPFTAIEDAVADYVTGYLAKDDPYR
ncbi:MAG: ADP-glyceromanno-heptose 6-epimerase [Alphaproteobacteria bacterium]|nr:ADP-glyceromanno-heptose 6-epimerase [Alphaproteobacteria bacterium]